MRARSRGFSLLEIMIVVVILAIGAGLAAYAFYGGAKKQDVRAASREVVGALREVRQLAMSGEVMPGLACGTPNCVPRTTGIRFLSRTSFEVFGDIDPAPGGELVVRTFDLASRGADNQVRFTTPPDGAEIRFTRQGVLAGPSATVTLIDATSGESHAILVTAAGSITLDGA